MEIRAARDNVLHGTAQGTLLVALRGKDDVLRTVKLPIVLKCLVCRGIYFPVAARRPSGLVGKLHTC